MIHICYAISDPNSRYCKFLAVSMISLFKNTSSTLTVHILHDESLTVDNRDKLIWLAGRYNQQIKFYNCNSLVADDMNFIKQNIPLLSAFNIATMFRFFIPKVLPADIDKVIYLDADTMINLDIKTFWEVDLNDKPLAAISEVLNNSPKKDLPMCIDEIVNYEDYFNAGVLYLNLKFFRDNYDLIYKGMIWYSEYEHRTFFDQDILNYLFANNYVKLPRKFNSFCSRLNEQSLSEKIYHFAGVKPNCDFNNIHYRAFINYFLDTPFFSNQTFKNIYEVTNAIYQRANFNLIVMTKMLAGKSRAFIVDNQYIDAMRNQFAIEAKELIIPPPRSVS